MVEMNHHVSILLVLIFYLQLKIHLLFLYKNHCNDSYKETIDGSSIEGKKLKLREWKHGDSFQPLGMTGKKKISDLLIDKKIDFFHKEKQMVVTADKKIIWVCGYQISETVKVLDKTTNFMELSLK